MRDAWSITGRARDDRRDNYSKDARYRCEALLLGTVHLRNRTTARRVCHEVYCQPALCEVLASKPVERSRPGRVVEYHRPRNSLIRPPEPKTLAITRGLPSEN